MTREFDPYYEWLAIPPAEQPPDFYRLLHVHPFEQDRDVIHSAADRQMAHVRTFQSGSRGEYTQPLLNEIAQARVTLTDPARKAHYDRELRMRTAAAGKAAAEVALPAAPLPPLTEQPLAPYSASPAVEQPLPSPEQFPAQPVVSPEPTPLAPLANDDLLNADLGSQQAGWQPPGYPPPGWAAASAASPRRQIPPAVWLAAAAAGIGLLFVLGLGAITAIVVVRNAVPESPAQGSPVPANPTPENVAQVDETPAEAPPTDEFPPPVSPPPSPSPAPVPSAYESDADAAPVAPEAGSPPSSDDREAIQITNPGSLFTSSKEAVIGWEFRTSSKLTVTHLGVFGKGGRNSARLVEAHPIGLWEDGRSTPLALTEIPAGTNAASRNYIHYVPIEPVELEPGTTYVIGAHYATNRDRYVREGNSGRFAATFSDEITIGLSRRDNNVIRLTCPERKLPAPPNKRWTLIGPSFLFESP